MINIILGNIASLVSCLLDSFSATKKNRKEMLKIQCFSVLVYTIANTLLQAYSAVVQNVCSLIRNILATKGIENKTIEYIIIAASLLFGIYFNNLGLMGFLPVFANVEYSICMFVLKGNVKGLKISFFICNMCFLIFNLYIKNYVGFVFTAIILISTMFSLIKDN